MNTDNYEKIICLNYDEINKDEEQYLNLIKEIIFTGSKKSDRTNIGTYSIFGPQLKFNLRNSFPLMTTKSVFWRCIVEELLWFIKGCTDAKYLQKKNIHIWDGNSTREFLDKVGLKEREVGDLGPIYGFQWRHFGDEYGTCHDDYKNKGIDQLKQVIDTIRKDPNNRRIIMSAWNPIDISKMALPPCHCLVQFYVNNNELSAKLYQRSADMGLGIPFNIASYSLLVYIIAHICDLKPGDFIISMGDAHVYLNHVDALKEQIKRRPKPFPKLLIKNKKTNIEDFEFEDFELQDYNPHPKIYLEMAI